MRYIRKPKSPASEIEEDFVPKTSPFFETLFEEDDISAGAEIEKIIENVSLIVYYTIINVIFSFVMKRFKSHQ